VLSWLTPFAITLQAAKQNVLGMGDRYRQFTAQPSARLSLKLRSIPEAIWTVFVVNALFCSLLFLLTMASAACAS